MRVSIYKNWLYVYDEAGWTEASMFTKPCIGEITSGDLRYKDVHIMAKRGPQNGVYAVVWCGSRVQPWTGVKG